MHIASGDARRYTHIGSSILFFPLQRIIGISRAWAGVANITPPSGLCIQCKKAGIYQFFGLLIEVAYIVLEVGRNIRQAHIVLVSPSECRRYAS